MALADIEKSQGTLASEQVSSVAIIVGAGPVGYRCAMELSSLCGDMEVVLIGDEPCKPYNRIKLSSLLAGEVDRNAVFNPLPKKENGSLIQYRNMSVSSIDPKNQRITDNEKNSLQYDHLILATGSRARKLDVEGASLSGVYTFRNMHDTEALSARSLLSKNCIVIGGGLLGLEVARGMNCGNTQVTLLQRADQLMEQQLDKDSADVLLKKIQSTGIKVLTNTCVNRIIGVTNVAGVETDSGRVIDCDTVIICTGVLPNIEIAKKAGINVDRGIVVSSRLETSHNNIYAIGECCEYEGILSGLVAPGLQQAHVLANCLSGKKQSFDHPPSFTQLKIQDEFVASLGDIYSASKNDEVEILRYSDTDNNISRTIALLRGDVIAACCISEWDELSYIREAFKFKLKFTAEQKANFKVTGIIGVNAETRQKGNQCDSKIICHCMHVDRSRINEAIGNGATSVFLLGVKTGAGTICGSCHPQLQAIVSNKKGGLFIIPDIKGRRLLLSVSALALVFSLLLYFSPGLPSVASVQNFQYDLLWKSSFSKQATGFLLLVVFSLTLLMSLRKRFNWEFLGDYSNLRVLHGVLGGVGLLIILAHTGAHLGSNLNKYLMINVLSLVGVGAMAALALIFSNKFKLGIRFKKIGYWLHVIISWPLPALLCAHIFTVYYF